MAPERLWRNEANRPLKVSLGLFLQRWKGPGEFRAEVGHDNAVFWKNPVDCCVEGQQAQEMPHSQLDSRCQDPQDRCRRGRWQRGCREADGCLGI